MHNRRSSPFWPLSGFRLASLLALVLLLGLATDWYLSFSQSPLFHSPAIDEALHWQWAQALASGQGSPEIPYFRAPLYPWFLGGLTRLGLQLSGLRLAGMLACLAGAWLLSRWASRLGGPRAGLAVLFLILLNAGLIYYSPMLLIPALLLPLVIAGGLALWKAWQSGSRLWAPVAGMLLGLAGIARPTALPLLLPGLWLLWHHGQAAPARRRGQAAAFLASALLPLALVASINGWPASGVLVASQGGVNFWIGNNPVADGSSASLPGVGAAWEREDASQLADASGAIGPGAESRWFGQKAWHWLTTNPADAGLLWLRKASLVLERRPLGNNTPILALAGRSASLAWLLQFGWSLLLLLGLGGLLEGHPRSHAWRQWLLLAIGLQVLTVVAFFVNTRFLLPASVLLMLPAACWLAALSEHSLLEQRARLVLLLSLIGVGIMAFSPHPVICGALAGGLAGWWPGREASPARGSSWILGLVVLLPVLYVHHPWVPWLIMALSAPGWMRLLWPAQGFRHPRLLAMLVLLLLFQEINPLALGGQPERDGRARSRLQFQEGNAWQRLEQPEKAEHSFLRALEEWPGQAEVRLNLGILAEARGDFQQAAQWYGEELELEGGSAKAHNNLGNLALRAGRFERAIAEYELALALRPGLEDARWNLGLAHSRLGLALARDNQPDSALLQLDAVMRTPYRGKALDLLREALRSRLSDPGMSHPSPDARVRP